MGTYTCNARNYVDLKSFPLPPLTIDKHVRAKQRSNVTNMHVRKSRYSKFNILYIPWCFSINIDFIEMLNIISKYYFELISIVENT